MSVQSGMISEPPVNVNDSDHSAVTWLSIFFYSLRAGARVARFRRGKRKQQERRWLQQALLGEAAARHRQRPLRGSGWCKKRKKHLFEDERLLVWMRSKLFQKLSFQFVFFSFKILNQNLEHLKLACLAWRKVSRNNDLNLSNIESKSSLKLPADVMCLT